HSGTIPSFLEGFDTRAARFLKAAAYGFPPDEAVRYFESLGIVLKTERGNRVFPLSDRAEEILDALLREARSSGVVLVTSAPVTAVNPTEEGYIIVTGRGVYRSRAVILATGGLSMRRSGSTGAGYDFARALGHTVEPSRPSLVPLVTAETWPREVAGLALKNVELTAMVQGKRIRRFGEMLFTHHGIGGPITLEISRHLTDTLNSGGGPVRVEIDLKPALDEKKLDARLIREIQENPKRQLTNILATLLPSSLARVFINYFGFVPETSASHITREERVRLRTLLKALPLTVTATEPIEAALVTRGGVSLSGINPQTMESRLRPGLFFAGEVIDADGDCGGYNLHLCWATGMLAGKSAAESISQNEKN
ncbi:MAG: BaiN/RdsA family NAD(P)/FAD-dependent oxidoreductase, partial [Candidatus Latescibacterota bacterium]